MNSLKFYSYRLNLIQPAQQQLPFEHKTKEQYFYEVLEHVRESRKVAFESRSSKFLFLYIEELMEGVHGFALAKEEIFTKPVEGEFTIEEVADKRNPYIYIIIDQVSQIVLIQEKSTVFQDIETAVSKTQAFLSNYLEPHQVSPFLKPIINKKDFWQEVNSMDSISELDLVFNAPNLFRGRFRASELVKEVYEDFNISEFEIKLKNKLGQLKLLKDNIEDYIALVSAGAGKFILRATKDGRDYVIKSYDLNFKKSYVAERLQDIDNNKLRMDLNELDKLNDEKPNYPY